MNLKRFTARNARDALTLVRQTFGEDAIVMSTRPCAEGVEVLAMAPESLQQFERMAEEAEAAALASTPAAGRSATPAAATAPASPAAANLPGRTTGAARQDRVEPRLDAAAPGQRAAANPLLESSVAEDVEQLQMSTLSFQDYVRDRMRTRAGDNFDSARLDADMRRIYGQGDFDSVSYSLIEEGGERVLLVQAAEKPWGPHYLKFGLGLSSDLRGNAYFNLLASHRSTWLNAWGAEWRNDLQIGRNDRFSTEWYQPLHPTQRLFVAPRVLIGRELIDIYNENDVRLTTFRRVESRADLDLGGRLGAAGEWRLGVSRGHVRISDVSNTGAQGGSILPTVTTAGVRASLTVDELDSLRLPRSGYLGRLQLFASDSGWGAEDSYLKWEGEWRTALAAGPHSVRLDLSGGGRLGGRVLPTYEHFVLGGFLRLSGYRTGQLYGNRYELARLIYSYRLTGPTLFDGASIGASIEAGRIGQSLFGDASDRRRRSQSIFLAVDTPLGPVYLAYGWADRNNDAVYLFLGVP